jgi:hypothetical protein
MRLRITTLPDEEDASAKELAQGACRRIGNPDRRQQMDPRKFSELPRIDRVRLRPRLPDQLHLIRMCDDHMHPEGREMALQPVPVERRLECDGQRLRQRAQPSA